MKGTAAVRRQGTGDPILKRMLEERGLTEPPLWQHRPPETRARMARWKELGRYRDGPVNPRRTEISAIDETTSEIKKLARDLGASAVGCAVLSPIMIADGVELAHDNILCFIVGEDYSAALNGPRAVETESTSVYVRCAEIATRLAQHIRQMGYAAVAHHNGGDDIMAIPALWSAGLGELGKHGSLIHSELGASHRPGFVTTTLPLRPDRPISFGVQETCIHCNLCSNNCPADAIPRDEYVISEGVKRWITDVEKCYTVSRLREQYCHICVDVCPYVHMANSSATKKALYKGYMAKRKKAGYKTPAWFVEDEDAVFRKNGLSAPVRR
jgi:formate hydrogenlyase subunit 6/NADH:ubiquinone oxidoreductase subunit I